MKPWQFAILGLSLLATLGCRTDPGRVVPALERELRIQEDEIYRLRGEVEDLQDKVNYYERRDSRNKGDSRSASDRDTRSQEKGSAPADFAPPQINISSTPSSEVPDIIKGTGKASPLAPPEVPDELKNPSAPPPDKGSRMRRPGEEIIDSPEAAMADGPMLDNPPPGHPKNDKTSMRAGGDSRRVASISLNPDLTGGINDGKHPIDKGLLVVIEPRDSAGNVIEAPGKVVVSVLDPALEGEAARVARWEFTPGQTASMFRRTNGGSALHIETTWPNGVPVHNNLQVYVRYVTADGRKMETHQPIEIALGREKSPPPEAKARHDEPDLFPAASMAQRPAWSPDRR